MNWLAVALGGACGASLRYALVRGFGAAPYPYATQFANVLGSFLIGVLFVVISQRYGTQHPAYQLLIVGVLGGFTTYSSYSLDTLRLLEQGRVGGAMFYAVSTMALCLGVAALGLMLGRRLM